MNTKDIGDVAGKLPAVLRVLYLEDSESDFELVRANLRKHGFDAAVDWVNSERRFLDALSGSTYDIILSDYDLPGFNAHNALRIAQRLAPDTPFLCLSGAIGEETAVDLMKLGAKDYVSKLRLDRLTMAISRVLDEKRSHEARLAAEVALRKSEKLYRALFENMLNAVALCSMIEVDGAPPDVMFLAVNAAFERQSGLTDVVGRRISDIFPDIQEKDPELLQLYSRVARTGLPEHCEYYVKAMGMWLTLSVYCPLPGHFAVVFDVINERKMAEQTLQEQMQEMQRFLNLTVDRELAMVAMKQEVNNMLHELGRPAKYAVDESDEVFYA